jgi:hypothetical protein
VFNKNLLKNFSIMSIMAFIAKTLSMFENLFDRLMRMVPSASGKILYNKWILYFIFVVGLYDIVHFYQRGNTVAVAIFFIVGFLTSFFSKNMIVIIVSAIAVSHIFAYGNKMAEGFKDEEEEEEEGFEEGIDEEVDEEDTETEKKDAEKKTEKKDDEETDNFAVNIEKMQNILKQTEDLLKESKPEAFSTMKYSEY